MSAQAGKSGRVLEHRVSTRAKKILPAGALLWAWDADPTYQEQAGSKWLVLLPHRWSNMKLCSEMLLEVTVYCGKVRDQRGCQNMKYTTVEAS